MSQGSPFTNKKIFWEQKIFLKSGLGRGKQIYFQLWPNWIAISTQQSHKEGWSVDYDRKNPDFDFCLGQQINFLSRIVGLL